MRKTLEGDWEIPWTEEMIKEHIWRPVQEVMVNKESTTELSTTDPAAICDVISRRLSQRLGITPPPFPSHWTRGQDE